MSQANEATHSITVGVVRAHGRALMPMALLMAVGLIMMAAPIYVFLGEKRIDVSPSLWIAAFDLCRVVTGLFGILAIVFAVSERRSGSREGGTFSSVAGGVAFIAAAAVGLGLVVVVTGLAGFVLVYAGGAVAVEAFRAST